MRLDILDNLKNERDHVCSTILLTAYLNMDNRSWIFSVSRSLVLPPLRSRDQIVFQQMFEYVRYP